MGFIFTPVLSVELTQLCNLDCKHCLSGESKNVKITREILEKLFDEVVFAETLYLTGGEVFLAYEQIKMLLEIAKAKHVILRECAMLINGTVYDERIYTLLDEYFGNNYSVTISCDVYHDESMSRKFLGKEDVLEDSMRKHFNNKHCEGFKNAEAILINTGRAKNLNVLKNDFDPVGYFYDYFQHLGFLVGPLLFVGADGYITDGNLEVDSREEQSLGNILNESIQTMVERGGVRVKCGDVEKFFVAMDKRFEAHQKRKGEHYKFENHRLVINHDYKCLDFSEVLEDCNKLMRMFYEKGMDSIEFKESLDESCEKYPYDISQMVHKKVN